MMAIPRPKMVLMETILLLLPKVFMASTGTIPALMMALETTLRHNLGIEAVQGAVAVSTQVEPVPCGCSSLL